MSPAGAAQGASLGAFLVAVARALREGDSALCPPQAPRRADRAGPADCPGQSYRGGQAGKPGGTVRGPRAGGNTRDARPNDNYDFPGLFDPPDAGPARYAATAPRVADPVPGEQAEEPSAAEVDAAVDSLLGLSRRFYAAALRAWMSEEDIARDLVEVGLDLKARGELAFSDYGRPSLSRLAATLRRVNREVHLLEGFARFSPRKDGRWVALLEPTYNVLPSLAPFFAPRFGGEAYALVDLRRGYAIASRRDGARFSLECLQGASLVTCMPDEGDTEAVGLWRSYFRVIENEARHNPSLQRRLMPVRYWACLPEMGRDT